MSKAKRPRASAAARTVPLALDTNQVFRLVPWDPPPRTKAARLPVVDVPEQVRFDWKVTR